MLESEVEAPQDNVVFMAQPSQIDEIRRLMEILGWTVKDLQFAQLLKATIGRLWIARMDHAERVIETLRAKIREAGRGELLSPGAGPEGTSGRGGAA